jgi:hypothetical protein
LEFKRESSGVKVDDEGFVGGRGRLNNGVKESRRVGKTGGARKIEISAEGEENFMGGGEDSNADGGGLWRIGRRRMKVVEIKVIVIGQDFRCPIFMNKSIVGMKSNTRGFEYTMKKAIMA